jgi:hypothetical protein
VQELLGLDVVEVNRYVDGGRSGDRVRRRRDRRQPAVMELHRVLADLKDHRSICLLGAGDDRLCGLERDDVERQNSRACAIRG